MLRHVPDAFLLGLALRDVLENHDEMPARAPVGTQREELHSRGEHLAVAALQKLLALPRTRRANPLPDRALARVAPQHVERGQRPAQDVLRHVTGDRRERPVHRQHGAVGREDHDALATVLEHLGCEPQFVLGRLAVRDVKHDAVVDDLLVRDLGLARYALPPLHGAVGIQQPALETPDAAVAIRLDDGCEPPVPVFRVNQVRDPVHLLGLDSEDLLEPRAHPPEPAVAVCPLEPLVDDAGQVGGHVAEPGLALPQGGLRACTIGDVVCQESGAGDLACPAEDRGQLDLVELPAERRIAELGEDGELLPVEHSGQQGNHPVDVLRAVRSGLDHRIARPYRPPVEPLDLARIGRVAGDDPAVGLEGGNWMGQRLHHAVQPGVRFLQLAPCKLGRLLGSLARRQIPAHRQVDAVEHVRDGLELHRDESAVLAAQPRLA